MPSRFRAFTLIELLVVIAIIAILATLLLAVLSRGNREAQSASCKNHLHQIGLALEMYVSDHNVYPGGFRGPPFEPWAGQLAPYNPVPWTNVTWQCPTYIAEGGSVIWHPPPPAGGLFKASGSYAYNANGMLGYKEHRSGPVINGSAKGPKLGLGDLHVKVPENRIVAPGEMYAVGDTRPVQYLFGMDGFMIMRPWRNWPGHEANPPHAGGYNLLFADGHVSLVKRRDYLYPPRTAQNWNRDHQPHPELWSPTNEWALQN